MSIFEVTLWLGHYSDAHAVIFLSDGCSTINFFDLLVAESLASYKKIYFEVKGYVWSTVSHTVS